LIKHEALFHKTVFIEPFQSPIKQTILNLSVFRLWW